ncbi:sigma 54-interacting transcriptional regulator [Thalassobaculum litoreum]|uniref:sigma 54-interacting transcriptional regulator n=1 Tax=Thalassobaculum litoreum TaxID=420996 RepID=UPI000B88BFD7|nr:sigma 54-interacting transcriptional regulator [Thalassobaculum litoreum]
MAGASPIDPALCRFWRLIAIQCSLHGGPFQVVNCGAIPSELIESEFFGHRKERWSLKSGQVVKLFPSMIRTGFDEQDHTQALRG